jgi:hypothetical protein
MGHFYISQSDKGGLVFGGDLDFYASYAARGNLPMAEHVMEAGLTLMPMIGKAKMLRSWGGIMDMSPDGSPIIDKTHIEGLYLNCGWCYGGFKAVPGSGNVLRPSDRHRPPARGRDALPARSVRDGPRADGRRRHRQPAQPALRGTTMQITCPLCGPRDIREFTHQGRRDLPSPPGPEAGSEAWDDYLHNRENPAGRRGSCGTTDRAAARGWW